MFVFETGLLTPPRFIINFPTKRHWRGKSRIEDIESGLRDLVAVIRQKHIRSIAVPPLGSGLGGLSWDDVRPRIVAALSAIEGLDARIFEPGGAPSSDKMVHRRDVPKMTSGRAALIELMRRYLAGLLDPSVSLLEVHKLMYFMQEAGEPLRLRYSPALYGPYAENLRHVLQEIEGHYVSGYQDGGDAPGKQLTLVPGATEEASSFLASHADSLQRMNRVAELVEGFESPFGLELLATVHWVMKREGVQAADDLVAHVYAWNSRKRQFTPRQIAIAAGTLAARGVGARATLRSDELCRRIAYQADIEGWLRRSHQKTFARPLDSCFCGSKVRAPMTHLPSNPMSRPRSTNVYAAQECARPFGCDFARLRGGVTS